jgi:hypothetical protein
VIVKAAQWLTDLVTGIQFHRWILLFTAMLTSLCPSIGIRVLTARLEWLEPETGQSAVSSVKVLKK